MNDFTGLKAQVEYGLDFIAPDRTVEVSLRDLLFVHQVLGEFIRFFHQPLHTPDLAAVERFMGDAEAGGFELLARCYYEKLREVWPADVAKMFDDGHFDNPTPPFYFAPQAQD